MTEATCTLSEERGLTLVITTLPNKDAYGSMQALVCSERTDQQGLAVAEVQLLEEAEYAFEVVGWSGPLDLQPVEIFSPSREHGPTGRVRTGRATGTVLVRAHEPDGAVLGECTVEVRSRKLNYLSEYRWMLQRIADEAAEGLQSHFAASSLSAFKPQSSGDAETIYQRFAFIQSLLGAEGFVSSLHTVVNRPHEDFVTTSVSADPALGARVHSGLLRELAGPGPRHPVASLSFIESMPISLSRTEHVQTRNTAPNQFVRYALTEWRNLARLVGDECKKRNSLAATRGQAEASLLERELDEWLSAPIFREVDDLHQLPSGNTVLQRRAGYRDVYRAYLQATAATMVDWAGGGDAFAAGQRDVAALYEYWTFLELARVIGELPGFTVDRRPLFRRSRSGLSLDLARGSASVLTGAGYLRGTEVKLQLWFNRHFSRGESWTEPMRPDCSLRVEAQDGSNSAKWLHFDAKYRIDNYRQLFQDPATGSTDLAPVAGDVLKMHAYRDAIHRSSGAYVLYPGADEGSTEYNQFHEVLPGLGAFVLRPGPEGRAIASGALTLQRFILDAIDHLVATGTDEHRSTYWTDLTYTERRGRRWDRSHLSNRPPADTNVLLGFVRSEAHRQWIRATSLYNLRGDGRPGSVDLRSPELGADLLILYGEDDYLEAYRPTGALVLLTGRDLLDRGYPHEPGGDLYCCLELQEHLDLPDSVDAVSVREAARQGRQRRLWGAPRVSSLDVLLG